MSTGYVAVRDDAGIRSLSLNEKNFRRSAALGKRALRVDGRRADEVRKIRLKLGRWDNGAECTVQWGVGTRITAMCTADLVPPLPDRPNEGIVNFSVDLSPMSGTSFRQAPPVSTAPASMSTTNLRGPNFSDRDQRLLSNKILRSVERIVLVGGALDTEALVLLPGKWTWRFTIGLTVLDDGGNIVDACVMGAMAALRHYRKPQVDLATGDQEAASDFSSLPVMIPSTVKEATPLPLHHTPLSISFALVSPEEAVSASRVTALIDPTDREELLQSGTLSVAMNIHSEVCLVDFGGGCELPPNKLRECLATASFSARDLCKQLENALDDADKRARKERLALLQQRQSPDTIRPPVFGNESGSTPYLQEKHEGDEMDVDAVVSKSAIDTARTQAEEAYREQALDYSTGHFASAVKEDEPSRSNPKSNGSLLASLLRSAKVGQADGQEDFTTATKSKTVESMGAVSPTAPSVPVDKLFKPIENDKDEKTTEPKVKDGAFSDDEEEVTTVLRTEFQALPEQKQPRIDVDASPDHSRERDDVDDLAMAIKKKPKKKKTKSKK